MRKLEKIRYRNYYRLDKNSNNIVVSLYGEWEDMDSIEVFVKELHELTQGKYIRLYPSSYAQTSDNYEVEKINITDTIDLCIETSTNPKILIIVEISIGLFEYENFEELEIKCKEVIRKIYPAIKKNGIGGIKIL